MRRVVGCSVLCLGLLHGHFVQSGQADAPTFPYAAEVSVDEVEVRSGPGWDYYPTQRLARGERVEVHRHDAGGWLAIRPPEGSFSWVAARQAAVSADPRVAEVVLDATVAWVGSSVTLVPQHKWQVRMDRGELVEPLGEQAMSVGPGFATETYHKISPPAGEFRWIHARHTSPGKAAATSAPQNLRLIDYQSAANQTFETRPIAAAPGPAPIARADVSRELEKLRVELALLVTLPIEQWNLETLHRRCDVLTRAAQDTSFAREVAAVAQRIAEFETLQRRQEMAQERPTPAVDAEVAAHGVTAAPSVANSPEQTEVESAVGSGVGGNSDSVDADPRETEGWLMPVHSTRRVAPPFALLDDDGRVTAYVTPAPGLNLRRYLKQHVSIVGDQRYATALRATHITAERVVKQR